MNEWKEEIKEWLTNFLRERKIDQLTYWLTYWLIGWLPAWLIDLLAVTIRLTDWFTYLFTDLSTYITNQAAPRVSMSQYSVPWNSQRN